MNAVQCDYCGKFAPNSRARFRGGSQVLPSNWFAVETSKGGTPDGSDSRGEYGEFCSRTCISDFFAAPPKEAA